MRRRRVAAGAAAAVFLTALAATLWLLRDPEPYFVRRRSQLASATPGAASVEGEFLLQPVRLVASSGLAVELTVKRALADSGRRLPLVLVLGGHRTGRESARLVGPTPGTVLVGMSYPYAGDPRPEVLTFLRDIPKIRRAFLDTPPATMLALDYLLARPDVDTASVDAVGVSLGAPFVVIAGALDARIRRVWAMHGSGGSFAPLEMTMRRSIKVTPVRWIAAAIANIIIAGPRLAPEQWVRRLPPRSFIMVNARDDERMPRAKIDKLFAYAREPKEMIWIEGRHVRSDTAVVRPLVRIVRARVVPDSAESR